jgi:hypothetical protein
VPPLTPPHSIPQNPGQTTVLLVLPLVVALKCMKLKVFRKACCQEMLIYPLQFIETHIQSMAQVKVSFKKRNFIIIFDPTKMSMVFRFTQENIKTMYLTIDLT